MTYELFKQELVARLQQLFPCGTAISIQQISHNNNIILDGLTILEPEHNISPTIYLNHYFLSYQNGATFLSICEHILDYYHNHCPKQNIDTSFFTDYEQVRPRIVYKLIHCEKNKELLNEVPYFPYLDLAIVFYCLVSESPYENTSILIRKEHLEYWNISPDTLLLLARRNTPKLLRFCCDSLADLILPVLEQLPPREQTEAASVVREAVVPMYVLTNHQRFNGACCILYQDVLKQVAKRLNSDLYILPSSIHEVIVIPAEVTSCTAELSEMVREINQSEVSQEEILSDHVYFYSRRFNEISFCADDSSKQSYAAVNPLK